MISPTPAILTLVSAPLVDLSCTTSAMAAMAWLLSAKMPKRSLG